METTIAKTEQLKTGTTTVGLLAKDGVVLAADMKATLGNVASDLNVSKIHAINQNVALTIAGGVGDAQMIIRFLRAHAKQFEIERENRMTPKSVMTFLSNILNANRYYPYMAFFIVGGYNDQPELYSTDMVGGYNEIEHFTATGSGFMLAYGYLEDQYKAGLDVKEATRHAVRAINVARRRDVFTGGDGIKVLVITKNGITEISQKEVEKLL